MIAPRCYAIYLHPTASGPVDRLSIIEGCVWEATFGLQYEFVAFVTCYLGRSALSNAGGRFAPNFAALPNDVILVLYCIDGFCGAGRVIVVFGECSVFLKDDPETGMQWFSGHTSAVCPSTPAAPQSFLLPPHNHRTFRPTPGLGRVSRLVPSAVPMVAGGSA